MNNLYGQFPNGYYLEASQTVGGLPVVVHTNPNKQISFPVNCRNLTGGSSKKSYRKSKRSKRSKKKSKRHNKSKRSKKKSKRHNKSKKRRNR